MNLTSKTKIKVLDILLSLDINPHKSSIDDFQSYKHNFEFLSDLELLQYLRMLENEHLIDIEDYDDEGKISCLHIYPNAYIYIEEHDNEHNYKLLTIALMLISIAVAAIALIK